MSALDEIRERWEAATPGPWEWDGPGQARRGLYGKDDAQVLRCAPLLHPEQTNATAITHAPEDVSRLLAAVEAVEKLHAGWEHDAPDPLILLLVKRTREAIQTALGGKS